MDPTLKAALNDFIEREKLPSSYLEMAERWFIPLAETVLRRVAMHEGTFILGINGSQGSGKSTLAKLLRILLRQLAGVNSINLSLDDFYLTRAERERLAEDVHPLLLTRGVPGTHDIGLALSIMRQLQMPGQVAVPRFDKAMDDRKTESAWPRVVAPVDVIILEGWCLGVQAEDEADLDAPLNNLERDEDGNGVWRRYVNRQLRDPYPQLFGLLDYLVMLKAPAFHQVLCWRRLQEKKLATRVGDLAANRVMNDEELERFIQHYERLTRHALKTLPDDADVVYCLNENQGIVAMSGKPLI